MNDEALYGMLHYDFPIICGYNISAVAKTSHLKFDSYLATSCGVVCAHSGKHDSARQIHSIQCSGFNIVYILYATLAPNT